MQHKLNNRYPFVSIVTNTYNPDLAVFKQVLDSLKIQNYPKKYVEHIVVDGGSTNGADKLAKKYKCKVIVRTDLMEQEQMRASIGFNLAKGDILAVIQSDNIVTSSNWLLEMVVPFIENKDIFCVFSEKNSYLKSMHAITRYCALFGVNDPTIYYLKKTEKIRMDEKKYNKGSILKEEKGYYKVKFNRKNLPPLGDNGHMFLRKVMKKANDDVENYMHTDAFGKMLDLGYDTVGVVKNTIIHVQKPEILRSVKRRIELKEKFYDTYRGKRKYLVYDPNSKEDRINLILFIIFSITIVIPMIESVKGYLKIHDRAWFLHPLMCILMVSGFGLSEIRRKMK